MHLYNRRINLVGLVLELHNVLAMKRKVALLCFQNLSFSTFGGSKKQLSLEQLHVLTSQQFFSQERNHPIDSCR